MTRSAPTYCTYEGIRYEAFQFFALYSREQGPMSKRGLPHPAAFGVDQGTLGMSTACWEGYRFGLGIEGRDLVITDIVLMSRGEPGAWPTIQGVQGTIRDDYDWWANGRDPVWSGLRIPTAYTGPLALYHIDEDRAKAAPRQRRVPIERWPAHMTLDLPTPWKHEPTDRMKAGIACYLQHADRVLRVQVNAGQVTSIDDLSPELQRFRDELH